MAADVENMYENTAAWEVVPTQAENTSNGALGKAKSRGGGCSWWRTRGQALKMNAMTKNQV